jgi:hypothetical protein
MGAMRLPEGSQGNTCDGGHTTPVATVNDAALAGRDAALVAFDPPRRKQLTMSRMYLASLQYTPSPRTQIELDHERLLREERLATGQPRDRRTRGWIRILTPRVRAVRAV